MNISLAFHNLKEQCPRCYANEVSTWQPRNINTKMAEEFMERLGNPPCFCSGKALERFQEATKNPKPH